MNMIILKYLITSGLIVFVSEVAKRFDRLGALISALPLVTITVMVWLYLEGAPKEKIANHAFFTFWYVLPTLPMFLVMPWLLNKEINFWLALTGCGLITFLCFIITCIFVKYFGVELGL